MFIKDIQALLVKVVLFLCGHATAQRALEINVTVTPSQWYLVKFNEIEINRFYSCLCAQDVTVCGSNISQSTGNDIFNLTREISEQFSSVFYCELQPPSYDTMMCFRQPLSLCNCTTDCFTYVVNNQPCSNGEVAVKWTQNINGTFEDRAMSITEGNNSICTVVTASPGFAAPYIDGVTTGAKNFFPGGVTEIKAQHFQGNTESTNNGFNSTSGPNNGPLSDDNTGIIVGVLCGVVAVVVIFVVALLIWKRNLLDKLPKFRVLMSRLQRRTTRNAEINSSQYEDSSEYNDFDCQLSSEVAVKYNNNFVIAMQPNDGIEYWSNQSVNNDVLANPAFVVDSSPENSVAEDYENIQFNDRNDDGLIYEDGRKEIVTEKSTEINSGGDANYDDVYETTANLCLNSVLNGTDASPHEDVADTSLSKEYANLAEHYAKLNKQRSASVGPCNGIMDTYEDVELQTSKNNDLRHSLALALQGRSSKNKAQSMVEIIHLPPKTLNSEAIKTTVNGPDTSSLHTNSNSGYTRNLSTVEQLENKSQEPNFHDYDNSSVLSAEVQETSNVYFELEKETDVYGLAQSVIDEIDEGSEEEFDYFSHSNV